MITADNDFVLVEGGEVKYAVTGVRVTFEYDVLYEVFRTRIVPISGSPLAPELGSETVVFTAAQIQAKDAGSSGAYAYLKTLDCVELCVIDYLDAITENAGITFTN